ncbi:antibiotic biosynthesis monooxygenase [Mucilaginibacter sp. RS28]|uniref:Antibiotic biosynthesis monooxygenase n=1 Tax=Mucilaginibacter straminoryzae TaxID=2932774 RepID=A0A9X2BBR5_9SPHI|nr:putative quinol monooxygenase [Mucilaginibacter straminoryzae]MCJ8208548.1 antibiotic biosynthesis monooxygenase [Mucilaginibacter straminoryzae]
MSVKVINVLQCASDAEETFEQELKKLVDISLHEEGCLAYEIYQPKDKRGEYVMIEEWQNEDALSNHKGSSHYRHFIRVSPVLQNSPAEVKELVRLV